MAKEPGEAAGLALERDFSKPHISLLGLTRFYLVSAESQEELRSEPVLNL